MSIFTEKNILKRFILFLFGCMGFRFGLSYIIGKGLLPPFLFKLVGLLIGIIGISFLYLFIFGLRKTGPEVFGDKIWWNNLRPIHGLMYLSASYAIYTENKELASRILFIDASFGLFSFLVYHFFVR